MEHSKWIWIMEEVSSQNDCKALCFFWLLHYGSSQSSESNSAYPAGKWIFIFLKPLQIYIHIAYFIKYPDNTMFVPPLMFFSPRGLAPDNKVPLPVTNLHYWDPVQILTMWHCYELLLRCKWSFHRLFKAHVGIPRFQWEWAIDYLGN